QIRAEVNAARYRPVIRPDLMDWFHRLRVSANAQRIAGRNALSISIEGEQAWSDGNDIDRAGPQFTAVEFNRQRRASNGGRHRDLKVDLGWRDKEERRAPLQAGAVSDFDGGAIKRDGQGLGGGLLG